MQAGLKFTFNNNYHVELIDSHTGKIKQEGDFHNIAINNFKLFLAGQGNALGWYNIFRALDVGSGTTLPTVNNTALANKLWRTGPSATIIPTEWVDDYTVRRAMRYTFPATASYVGTVTEVGLVNTLISYSPNYSDSDGTLCTRALLTDSEGQQISFVKTDTDILNITVTVEVSMSSTSEAFKIFKKAQLLRYIIDTPYTQEGTYPAINDFRLGLPQLLRFDYNTERGYGRDTTVSTNLSTTNNSNNNEAYITCSARLANTTVTNQTYYKAIAIPSIGYWPLPNEEIFPTYSIKGIQVGTGDGTATIFENPLNYFKEGTDKIYKNGVQLTRGTDYTISNVGNKDCSPEINQTNKIVKVTSAIDLSPYVVNATPLIYPSAYVTKPVNTYDALTESPLFNYNNPLYIEYENPVTLNCVKAINEVIIISPTAVSNIPIGTTFYIDYSTDGETYVVAGSGATTQNNGTFIIDFEDKTAKYWRLRTSYNNGNKAIAVYSGDGHIVLNRKQPSITFAEAPADGDIITMDVDMDIIMKNSNFVIDLYFRLDFSI